MPPGSGHFLGSKRSLMLLSASRLGTDPLMVLVRMGHKEVLTKC